MPGIGNPQDSLLSLPLAPCAGYYRRLANYQKQIFFFLPWFYFFYLHLLIISFPPLFTHLLSFFGDITT